MSEAVIKNRYGFYELKDKPSPQALEEYYADKYYQENRSSYAKSYAAEEMEYVQNKIDQKYRIVTQLLPSDSAGCQMLDVGCGEGWALRFFRGKGWQVHGLDYSNDGISRHNPDLAGAVTVGDIYRSIEEIIGRGEKFDLIWLDNVLEHVLDPGALLDQCRQMIRGPGVLLLEVPNDFSIVQQKLLQGGQIPHPFWVAVPDHISYFNQAGLQALCRDHGWVCKRILGDFPIDWSLFNPRTNYITDRAAGPSSHQTRMAVENMLHDISAEQTNELYRIMGEMGLGRQIIGFFTS